MIENEPEDMDIIEEEDHDLLRPSQMESDEMIKSTVILDKVTD